MLPMFQFTLGVLAYRLEIRLLKELDIFEQRSGVGSVCPVLSDTVKTNFTYSLAENIM